MAVTLEIASKNAALDAVFDLVDGGTGLSAGYIELQTSGGTELATLSLSTPPAFNAASGGSKTANAITSETSANAGTAAICKFYDRDATLIVTGAVTATGGGGEITIDAIEIPASGIVNINSLTVGF